MSAQTESCRQGRLGSAESEVPVAETDRFGFLLGNSITAGDGPSPVLVRQQEVKWLNLMSHWEHFLERKTKKVKAHCQKGIPASLRAKCWPLLCGATHRREQNKNLYMSLDASPGQQSWIDIIQRDTNRQFPFHEMFLSKDSHGQQGLLRVLKAYTEFRPEEGYCQAQGPVAAVLLMNMPTEEAFWCLVQISELYLPGYYSPKLEGVLFDAALLYWVLKRACPAAYRHLHSQGVEPLMFATDWLMCLYSRHLPFNTLLRVWDLFFCYGVRVLFQVAVVLVRRCLGSSEQRRECEGQMETLEQLRSVQKRIEKEPTDTFLQEVCSVPLSNRELQRQTERELETWRREHPGSNFDPRWRCYGYQMAWERGRERQKEEEKQVWQRGNLSLPLQRSASSVSPLLFRRRWKKRWSKADAEDSGGSGEDRGAKSRSKEENKDRDAVRNYKYDACEEERDMEVTSVTTVDGSTHIQRGHTSHTDVASEDPTVKVEQQDDSGTVFTDESSGAKTQLHNSEETHNWQHQEERKQHDDKEEEPRNTHLPQPNPEASSHNVQPKTSHSNTEQQGAAQTFSDQQEEAVKTLSGQPEELQSHQCKQKENIHTISEYHDEKKTQRDRPETEVKTHTSHQEEETETYKNQEEEKLTLKKLQRIHTQMVEVEMKIQKRQLDEKNLMSCGLQKITLSFEDHQVNNTELGDGNQEEDVCQATELQTLCRQQAEEREATKEIPPPLILEGGEINPLLNLEEEEIMPIIYSEKEIQTSLNLQEEEIQPSLNLQEEDIQPSVNLQEEDIQLCLNLQEEDIQLCLNLQEEDIQPSLNVQEEEIQSLLNLEEERLSHQDEQIQQWNMNEEDIQPHLNIDQEESLIPKQCEEIQQSPSLEELQPSVGLWDNDNQPQSSHFTSEDKEIKSPLTGYEEEIPPPLNLEEPIQTPLSRQDEITPQQPLRLEDIQQPVNLHNNETKPFLYQEEDTESCLGRQSPPDQYGNHFKSPVCQDIEVQPQSQQENIIQKPFCQQEETQQPHSQQEFEIQTHIIQQEETKEADVSSEETEDRVDLTDIPGDTMRDKDKSENKERDNETMCHIISQTESISSHLCQEAPKSENPYQAESVLYPPDHKVQLRNRGHSLKGDSASKRVHQQSPEDAAHDINPSPNLTNAIPSLKSCIQKSKSTPTTPTPNPSTPMRLKRTSSSRTSYPTILSEETFKDPNKRDYQEEHTNPPSQMCCPQTTAKAHTNQTTPSPEAATLQHTQTTEMGMAQSPHAAKTDTTQNKGKSKTETLPNHAQQRETSRPKGLLRRLRGESTPKVKVPKILIQDFSEGEQKLSSKERRRRRREQEKKEKEEERERKRKEKEKLEKGKGREGKKPQTRGQSFQVPSKTSTSEAHTHDGTRTLPHERNSAPVFDNYF